MPLDEIGPRAFAYAEGVTNLSLTPKDGTALVISRITVNNPNGADVWRLMVGTSEIAAFDMQATGNQQPLSNTVSGARAGNDIFSVVQKYFPDPLRYPVPMGDTATLASDGGATGDITFEYTEYAPQEVSPGMTNYPGQRRELLLVSAYVAALPTADGEYELDTEILPHGHFPIFTATQIPTGIQVRILGMFLEGAGVNSYDSSSDVQAVTQYFAVTRNGTHLFTRDLPGGIPLVGEASAASSKNTVVGTVQTPYPALQLVTEFDWMWPTQPLVLSGPDAYQFRLGLKGAYGANSDFSVARQAFLLDIMRGG